MKNQGSPHVGWPAEYNTQALPRVNVRVRPGNTQGVFTLVFTLLTARHQEVPASNAMAEGQMMAKKLSYTRTSIRKIKRKAGGLKIVLVKGHVNRINRKPKKR